MTRVIIEGLRDRASLINAISVVLDTLNSDDAYTPAEHVFVPHTPTEPTWPKSPRRTRLSSPTPLHA